MAAAREPEPSLGRDLTGIDGNRLGHRIHYKGFYEAITMKFKLLGDASLFCTSVAQNQLNFTELQIIIREFPEYIHQLMLGNDTYINEDKRFKYLNILFVLNLMYNIWDSVHDFEKKLEDICKSFLLDESFQTHIKESVKKILNGTPANQCLIGMYSPQEMKKRFKEALNTSLGPLYPEGADTLANSYLFYFIMLTTLLTRSHEMLGDPVSHVKYITSQEQSPEDKYMTILSIQYDILSKIAHMCPTIITDQKFKGYEYQKQLLLNAAGAEGADARILDTFRRMGQAELIVKFSDIYRIEDKRNKWGLYTLPNLRAFCMANDSGNLAEYIEHSLTPNLLEITDSFTDKIQGLLQGYVYKTVDCCVPLVISEMLRQAGIQEAFTGATLVDGRASSTGVDQKRYYKSAPSILFAYLATAIQHRNSQWTFQYNIDDSVTHTLNVFYPNQAEDDTLRFNIQLIEDTDNKDYHVFFNIGNAININLIGNSLYGLLSNLASITNMKRMYSKLLSLSDARDQPTEIQVLSSLPPFLGKFIEIIFKRILIAEHTIAEGEFQWNTYKDRILSIVPFIRYCKCLTDLLQQNSESKDRLSAFGELMNVNKIWGAQKGNKAKIGTVNSRFYVGLILGDGFTSIQENRNPGPPDNPPFRNSMSDLLVDEAALLRARLGRIREDLRKLIERYPILAGTTVDEITALDIKIQQDINDHILSSEQDIAEMVQTHFKDFKEQKEQKFFKDKAATIVNIIHQMCIKRILRYFQDNPLIEKQIKTLVDKAEFPIDNVDGMTQEVLDKLLSKYYEDIEVKVRAEYPKMIDGANEEAERLKNGIRRGDIRDKIRSLRVSKKKGSVPEQIDPDVETIQSIYKKGIASLAASSSRLRLPIEDDVVSTLEGLQQTSKGYEGSFPPSPDFEEVYKNVGKASDE